jgi:hypothetical protein
MSKAIRANQEFFDLLAGDIFARLYVAFPQPIDVYTDAIIHNNALGTQDGFDDDPDRLVALYSHTITWLGGEGFIKFSEAAGRGKRGDIFCDVVLTAKGLEAPRKTPGSLVGPGETLGDKIEAAVKDISSDAAKGAMKQFVGIALGWFVRGVGAV